MWGSYAIIVVLAVSLFFATNSAFATVTIVPASGSSTPGCEETSSGCFIPSAVVVDVGEKIIFSNTDTAAHTWTANNGEFDTSLIMPGVSYEYSPNSGGDIPYFCMIHPWMQGLIIVQGAPSVQYYSLDLNVSTSTVLEDEIAVISGLLTSSEYISGYEVSVKLTTNTGLTASTWILDGGYYDFNVVWPVGVHTVTTTFDTDSGTLVSNSVVLTVKTPDLPGTIITLDSFQSFIITGEVISFSGQLVDENGIPIFGKIVWVFGDSDTGRGQGKSAITDSNGQFTTDFDNWRENDAGNWTIYAEFEGDSEYKESSSNTRQLEVTLPEPEPQISITVSTGKISYDSDDSPGVTGVITNYSYGDVTLVVTNPEGDSVEIQQLTPGTDGYFFPHLVIGPTYDSSGTYTITVNHNGYTATTTFEFTLLEPEPVYANVSFTNPRSVDAFGNVLTNIGVSQQIQIATDVTNYSNFSQDFAYYISIRGTEVEAWITGLLSSGQSFSPALSWIPTEVGTFTVDISLFDNIENKHKLSESVTLQIIVTEPEPVIEDVLLALKPISDYSVEVEKTITFTASLVDSSIEDAVFSLDNEPSGATIDPNSGKFVWTPLKSHGSFQDVFYSFDIVVNSGAQEDRENIIITVKQAYVEPEHPGTIITLDSFKSSVTTGSIISFSGQLVDENGIPIFGKLVWVFGDSDTGSGQGKSAITDSNGQFTTDFDNWREEDVGNWTIYAEFEGDSEYKESSSNTRQLEVTLPEPEPQFSITVTANQGSDSITVTGKTVSDITDVTYTVTAPSGVHTMAVGQVSPDENGEFMFKLLVGQLWTEDGFYEIQVMQSVTANSLYTLHVLVEVIGGMTEQTSITEFTLETLVILDLGLTIEAIAESGSTTIEIIGSTDRISEGITVSVYAPNELVIAIDQVYPMSNGEFSLVFTTGGPLWIQDGYYTITAHQNDNPKYNASTEVYIKDGIVNGAEPDPGETLYPDLYFTPPPNRIEVGTPLEFSGQLTADELHVTGKTIYIKDDIDFGTDRLIISATTDQNGEFSVTWDAVLRTSGSYDFYAVFEGDSEAFRARSATYSVYVSTEPVPPPPTGNNVEIPLGSSSSGCVTTNSCLLPSTISVDVGETVKWYNADTSKHTVTSGNTSDDVVGTVFDSSIIMSGSTFEVTFTQDGTFPYFCVLHPWVLGTVIVGDGGGPIVDPTISVSTEKSSYTTGDTINVSGSVSPITQNIALTYVITNPEGDIITIDQLILNSDGTFEFSLNSDGALWELSGTHTIRAVYGTAIAETTFTFTTSAPGVLGDEHVHASILVQIFSDEFDFSVPDFQIKSSQIHFEERDGKTIHRHESGITLGYLFETLGIVLDDQCYVFPDGKSFCTNGDYVLEFFINQQQVTNITNYVFSEGDEISIIFEELLPDSGETLYPDLYFTPPPNRIEVGTPLEFSGQLTADELHVTGKTIYIKDDIDFGTDRLIISATTDQNGEFSVTWDAVLRTSGSYDFYAVFEGDSEAFRARSATYSVYVSTEPVPPPPTGNNVEIPLGSSSSGCVTTNSCLLPSTISVDVGETVKWYNADTSKHTVTSGNTSDDVVGTVFDSSIIMSGSTFEVTFTQDGTFPYFCVLHPWVLGTVIVGDGGGPIVDPTISVSTDKSSYTTGDTINVSGSISQITQNVALTHVITNPEGDVLTLGQYDSITSRTYSISIITGGPLWELSGTHTIKVRYGMAVADTTFTFTSEPKISASVLVLDPLPTTVNREDFVLITGKLKTESGMPITFRTINLINDNDGLVATRTTTNSNGEFTFSWNVKYTYNTYRWYAEFTGDNQFLPSHSEIQSVSVKLYPDLYFTPLQNRILIGTPLEFSGQLTVEGLSLAGKTIYIKDDIDFGTDRHIVSTTTDQNGEFSITWDPVLRSSGSYDFYAVFEGDSEAFRARSATYSVYVSVTQVFEPVRVYTEKTVFSEGDILQISGSATPNEELEIALLDSRENIIMQKSVRVGSTGLFNMEFFTWNSSSNLNFGEYRIIAWSPIDLRYDSLWVSFIQLEPETFQTKITLNRPQSSVTLNKPITFTGQLQTMDGQPLTFTTVGIATITNYVPEVLGTGTTDSSGKFSITWTSKYTSSSTTIPVFAYFGGNQVFDHSISDSYNITIEKPSLSLFTEKTSYKAGELLIASGYGSPGDTINVSLRSQQGQIMSNSVKVASDGSYTIFFDLTGLSQGSYTVTAISSSFGITDSTTIFVEAKEILESTNIVGSVYFTDQGRKVPLSGIKAVLNIGANQRVDYVDSSGKFEFNNIDFDSRVSYLIHFEMTDGKSFNFIDSQLYSTSTTNPSVIKSRTMLLNIDETLATNHFAINLGLNMPSSYSSTDTYYIHKAFDLQSKVVNFYNRVLNEKPPMINVFLFQDGSSYSPVVWNSKTGDVESTYQPKIRLSTATTGMWSGIGM